MRKENLKSLIIIGLIVTFALSATYAYLTLSTNQNTTNTLAGCFEVSYTGQNITQSSLKSTENYLEGASSQITLSKAENCEIYTQADIYIHTNTPTLETDLTADDLAKGALKYKILEGRTSLAEGSITATGDKKITTVDLTTTTKTYTIYIWIDPTISNGSYNGKTYSGYIYATSIQTSTVTQ